MSGRPPFPVARGRRRGWHEVPAQLRAHVERSLGDSVAAVESIPHGFSPGVAARLRLHHGRTVFVKATSADWNPDAAAAHRHEARISPQLPAGAHAPRLLLAVGDDQWIVLAFEDVGGGPPQMPWRRDELGRVLETLAELAEVLSPSPLALPPAIVAQDFSELLLFARLRDGGDALDDLDPWLVAHLDRLVDVEAQAPAAAAGHTLLHCDIRADNLLLTDRCVWLVDWPHASVGAAWVDLLAMLPSVVMQGGGDAEKIFAKHPVAARADRDAVTATLAALAGFFLGHGRRPEPPGLPGLRAFQQAQGAAALGWVSRRTGWR